MKKLLGLLLISIMGLSAGTVGGESKDPRVFGKLFFDYTIGGVTSYEYVTYSGRKTFAFASKDVKYIIKNGDRTPFTIKGRIAIPDHIKTSDVMVNVAVLEVRAPYSVSTAWAESYVAGQMLKTPVSTTPILEDDLGNRYIEFEYRGLFRKSDRAKGLAANFQKATVKIASATKKRGKSYQWKNAKFYVIEE